MASDAGMLYSLHKSSPSSSVTVGNGSTLPISHIGHASLPASARTLHLNNVLLIPNIVKNLISIRRFTIDNLCSIEFDPFGFFVKDLCTKAVILRCNSRGDLYAFTSPALHPTAQGLIASTTTELWHRRLGHPGRDSMSHLYKKSFIPCNKAATRVCHACQLGKHVRLPFIRSTSKSVVLFELIHCDLWTSPVLSNSGFKYYLVIVDDFSHFMWTFPLRTKSEIADTLLSFVAYART
jgi:hypothetical protein